MKMWLSLLFELDIFGANKHFSAKTLIINKQNLWWAPVQTKNAHKRKEKISR